MLKRERVKEDQDVMKDIDTLTIKQLGCSKILILILAALFRFFHLLTCKHKVK